MRTLEQIYAPIEPGLGEVDRLIAARIHPRFRALCGGKRLRPALVLLTARDFGPAPGLSAVKVAAALEMVHVASLVHDDVIDSAARRRCGTALHRLIGTKAAVVLADLLFVEGLALIDAVRPAALVHEVIAGVREMCEGQWLEVRMARAKLPGWSEYAEVIDKKTASLFDCCCRVGGLLRRAPAREMVALGTFGRRFGQVYQLLDDAADAGHDQGPTDRILHRLGGPRYLRRRAQSLAAEARQALGSLPRGPEQSALSALMAVVFDRPEGRR